MFGLGLADWVYRKNVNFGKGVSSSITFPILITIRLVIMIPLFGLLYFVNLRNNALMDIFWLSSLAFFTSLYSVMFTIFAAFFPDALTVTAAVFNEISISYNFGATLGFWILLVPIYWKYFDPFTKVFYSILHTVPLLCHFINTGITYENLMLNDSRLAIVFGLLYGYLNIIGSFDAGAPIYAPFNWFETPFLATVLMFIQIAVITWCYSTFTKTMNQCKVNKK